MNDPIIEYQNQSIIISNISQFQQLQQHFGNQQKIKQILMPTYSGFSTKQQEQNYNRLLEGTIRILSSRLIKFYELYPLDQDAVFVQLLSKNVNYLALLEQTKSSPPKFIDSLKDICTHLNIKIPPNEQKISIQLIQSHTPQQRRTPISSKNCNFKPPQKVDSPKTFKTVPNEKFPPQRVSSSEQNKNRSPKRNIGSAEGQKLKHWTFEQRNQNNKDSKMSQYMNQSLDQSPLPKKNSRYNSIQSNNVSLTPEFIQTNYQVERSFSKSSGKKEAKGSNQESKQGKNVKNSLENDSSFIQNELNQQFGMQQKNQMPRRLPSIQKSQIPSPKSRLERQLILPQMSSFIINPQSTEFNQVQIKTYSVINNNNMQ